MKNVSGISVQKMLCLLMESGFVSLRTMYCDLEQ